MTNFKSTSGKIYSNQLDLEWLRPLIPIEGTDYTREHLEFTSCPLNGAGGLIASMYSLFITSREDSEFDLKLIYKTNAPTVDALKQSIDLGLAREALFYSCIAPQPTSSYSFCLPKGDMKTGMKNILLEDLTGKAVQSGLLFGAKAPINLGKDLDASIGHIFEMHNAIIPSAQEVASATFHQLGILHRVFWTDQLFTKSHSSWLRGVNWGITGDLIGLDRETWELTQSFAVYRWKETMVKIESEVSKVKWDQNLVDCMISSLDKIDWEQHLEDCKNRPWTLNHGDFHAGNIFWAPAPNSNSPDFVGSIGHPIFLDWEGVGVGSGPGELGWYMIFHMDPTKRQACEETLLLEYYATLTSESINNSKPVDASSYSFDQCKHDYVYGGVERAMYCLAYVSNMFNDPFLQAFQDQIASFLTDHEVTPVSIGMTRLW